MTTNGQVYDAESFYRALLLVRRVPSLVTMEKTAKGIYFKFNGKPHREDGPAVVHYNPLWIRGTKEVCYYWHGLRHRKDGPAIIDYNGTGTLYRTVYYNYDKLHREDGPAVTYFNLFTHTITSEYYYWHGLRHRKDGPAVIEYNLDGEVARRHYWENDKKIKIAV